MGDSRGQASIDYVAVLTVVAVCFGVAITAVGAPWLAPRVAGAIRHGICVVSGALCTPREAREAGLEPCPIQRRSAAERLGVVALIRLERGDALLVERRSDGSASVSFVDSGKAGVEVGMGGRLPSVVADGKLGVGAQFAAGRTFEFERWDQAKRFLARFAGDETVTGEGRRVLRGLCRHCPEWLKGRARALPEPAATYVEGGSYRDFAGRLGAELPAEIRRGLVGLEVQGGRAAVLGRRVAGRRTTWYLRLEAGVLASLGAVLGSIENGRQAEGVLEVSTVAGRPVQARVRASAAMLGAAGIPGLQVDVAGLADRLREATAGSDPSAPHGLAVEAAVSLDLREPANRRALDGLLHPGLSPLGWLERLRAVGRRLDAAGAVDLSVMRSSSDSTDHSLEGGALVRFGGGYGRVEETRDLIAAWSLPPGGRLRRREDCERAALAAAA